MQVSATIFKNIKTNGFSRCILYSLVVLPPDGIPDVKWNKIPATDALGSFEMLLDEELAAQGDSGQGLLGSSGSGAGGSTGRKGTSRGNASWLKS